jgi:heme o synthase
MSSVAQTLAVTRASAWLRLQDYFELVKLRITSLIVMTAWCGFYLGAAKTGVPSLGWTLLHAMLGIGLVAAGTAAMNEVLEREADARMRRTAGRPLPAGRMSVAHATGVGLAAILGGAVYLSLATNLLSGALVLATSVTYLAVYTPLKKISPLCTFIGAFPGAMPGVLGWTVARGRVEVEALVLFAIVFFWQFPHFHSIAWLYREDYENAQIRMLAVVDADGRSTVRSMVLHLVVLVPVSVAPALLGMSGWIYGAGAVALGLAFLWSGMRLARLKLPPSDGGSKRAARAVLVASVFYLPLLFALMMLNAG